MTGGCFADLQHTDDVRMPSQPAHRPLFTQEPLPVLVEIGGEHLDRHRAVQGDLSAPVDDPETAPTNLLSILESGRAQLRNDGRALVALRIEQIPIRHRPPAIHPDARLAYLRQTIRSWLPMPVADFTARRPCPPLQRPNATQDSTSSRQVRSVVSLSWPLPNARAVSSRQGHHERALIGVFPCFVMYLADLVHGGFDGRMRRGTGIPSCRSTD